MVTAIGVFTFLLEIGFAATAFGTWFRLYSIATIVVMLVFGAITSFYAPQVQANEPTPWVGAYERINAYGYMLWIGVLAGLLLRQQRPPVDERKRSRPGGLQHQKAPPVR
jgi:hypothetical protein